ncbi:helix-turn-helix domain-containing protein [Bradyrhizobium sp. NDS-1]|uniref:helix-turn-helix domain-containing protein n=1 Tax=Bradyrhizobium sp. NDS-1 TaxID=3080014 RepID=UPI00293EDC0D|nr:helix-turn-helix domain-containing protein [Bradyrhizobium sp. NDS-1]WOH71127.1 helix-turn-helix domain-containing protein [Bradyrhizobium sp. NDS-1]
MENVEPIDTIPRDLTRVRDRWGIVADPGYLALPFVILLFQGKLGLRPDDLNVLMNYLAHWHAADRMPFPHSITIAKRMGVSPRTVQRSLSRLQKGGFIRKMKKRHPKDPVAYDMNPLVEMLTPYAESRIRITAPTEFESNLDEAFLRSVTRMSASEMFKEVAALVKKSAADDL